MRKIRFDEMQKIKGELQEQDQKWQDVSAMANTFCCYTFHYIKVYIKLYVYFFGF